MSATPTKEVVLLEGEIKDNEQQKETKHKGGYFCEEEEEAFKNYLTSKDSEYRNKIFREKLYPVFTKMIESIIRRYNLFTPYESFEETFNDTISFLLTKVNNFDFSKGYKAYSYCGTVCKNYLLFKRTQAIKRSSKVLPYEEVFPEGDNTHVEEMKEIEESTQQMLINQMQLMIKEVFNNEEARSCLTEIQKKVGYALLYMLENWEELFLQMGSNKFNKSSILYFLKEYTLLTTKEVREGTKPFKQIYLELKENLLRD